MPPPSPSQYWIALDLLDRPQKLNCTTFFLVGYIMNLFTIGIYITYITLGRIIIVKSIQNCRNCQNCRRRKNKKIVDIVKIVQKWENCELLFVANLLFSRLALFSNNKCPLFTFFEGDIVRFLSSFSPKKSLLQPQNPTLHCTNLISCTF